MGIFKMGTMTIGSIFKKPETILYPVQKKPAPKGLKGHVVNDVDTCILCGICEKRCPTGAISVDKQGGTWNIDRFLCIQCGSCVRECPKQSLTMDPAYTPPATSKYVDSISVPEHPKSKETKNEEAVNVSE